MLQRRFLMVSGLATLPALAQGPIDLGIPNIRQQTQVWCWVAVAEQIIRWKNGGGSPSQAELVSIANGWPPQACPMANNPMMLQACIRTGGLHEIAGLIGAFSMSAAGFAPPAAWPLLYQTLAQRRPIILSVQATPYSGHVVVLRGIVPGPDPILLINDPMGWPGFFQGVPFSRLLQFWTGAIVVA